MADPALRFAYPFRIDHYSWTTTRRGTFQRRVATPGVSSAGAEVGDKMIRYLSEHGRIRLGDFAVRDTNGPRRDGAWKRRMLAIRLGSRMPRMAPLPERSLG